MTLRGKESDPHKVMAEAFELRLRHLFSTSEIKLGKKIHSVGLKPDIYIEHSDGQKWVYEMVQGNKKPSHLMENHQRYHNAGIHDFWILWDDPHPIINRPPLNQGLFLQEIDNSRFVEHVNKLTKVIYSIHADHYTDHRSMLYAFDIDQELIENEHTPEFMKVFAYGIRVYKTQDYSVGLDKLKVSSELISLPELGFDQNGFVVQNPSDEYDSGPSNDFDFAQEGFIIPEDALEKIKILESDKNKQAELISLKIQIIYNQLTPNEREEIDKCIKNGGMTNLKLPDFLGILNNQPISMGTGSGLMNIAKISKAINQWVDAQVSFPPAMKKLFAHLLYSDDMLSIGKAMKWAENSSAVKGLNFTCPK